MEVLGRADLNSVYLLILLFIELILFETGKGGGVRRVREDREV